MYRSALKFFLLAFVGPALFTLLISLVVPGFQDVSVFPVPIVQAAGETHAQAYRVFPVARSVPIRLATALPKIIPIPQVHLIIPKIGVNAVVKAMGLTLAGAMAVPDSRVDVGWFDLGTTPGQAGSAVIGGHNFWADGSGAFVRLDELDIGDALSVVDAHGVSTRFVVRETREYDPTDVATEVFQSASGIHLNLITCSGVLDPTTKSYSKRLVVFTDADLPVLALE